MQRIIDLSEPVASLDPNVAPYHALLRPSDPYGDAAWRDIYRSLYELHKIAWRIWRLEQPPDPAAHSALHATNTRVSRSYT